MIIKQIEAYKLHIMNVTSTNLILISEVSCFFYVLGFTMHNFVILFAWRILKSKIVF